MPNVSTVGPEQDLAGAVEELKRELSDAHRREAATTEVLKVISSSPTDVQPVFDTIVRSAVLLCGAMFGSAVRFDGELMHLVAGYNYTLEVDQALRAAFPMRPSPRMMSGRAILSRDVVQVEDALDDPHYPKDIAQAGGFRSMLAAPMLRVGRPIGAIVVNRGEPGPFSPTQIQLLRTFAEQAVIAIENTRLFEEVQARTRELSASLEQQMATSEVLSVISRSSGDLQPVFQIMLESATRVCASNFGTMYLREGDSFRTVAMHGAARAHIEARMGEPLFKPGPSTGLGRVAQTNEVVHVEDVTTEQAYLERDPLRVAAVEQGGVRSHLSVPMLKDNELIGVFSIYRQEVRPFTDKEIELLKGFASQAVIAIENSRLLNELRESLEFQTATSEVLSVVNRSKFNLEPVLDTIARVASQLCVAEDVVIHLKEQSDLRIAAHYGSIPVEPNLKRPIGRGWVAGRTVVDRKPIHVPDMASVADEFPLGHQLAQRRGYGTTLGVPLLRENEAIGCLLLRRLVAQPFTEKQIALLQTFADQAVIAIENTRLFEAEQASKRELQEALEYQTATSEVLNVISRSPTELQPVLDAIAATAARLCESMNAIVWRVAGGRVRVVAQFGSPTNSSALPLTRGSVTARAIVDRKTIHVHDLAAMVETEYPDVKETQQRVGHRTTLATPLLSQGQALGAISVRKNHVHPFSDGQIALLQTFADQAVIAIENARLFEEIAQKSRELEIASQHKSQFVANMSHELRTPLAAVLGYAELLQEGIYGALPEKSLPILTRIRSNGQHLLGLINTVLDISKIEAGQFKLNLAEYALGSLVETVMVATESLAATKKLAFKMDVSKGLPYGLGDEQRLTQVLLNLVGNAIKFTDAGEVRIAAGVGNGHFAVSVSDTGPGIPPEECEHIFEKFRQVDSSNTRAKGGTGLGLAIAREIIEMHGGRIWVESTLGQGSTFRMQLPVCAPITAGAT